MNRYLSHSSAIINDQQKSKEHSKKRLAQVQIDERERRNTCTLPPPILSNLSPSKDRRSTLSSINWPVSTKTSEVVGIHQIADASTSTTNNGGLLPPPPRDTDSSSTQDSGYSESTPYYLVQQTTTEAEQKPNISKVFENFLSDIFAS